MKLREFRELFAFPKLPELSREAVRSDRLRFLREKQARTCPNCGAEGWHFIRGEQDYMGPKLTPDEGWCEECGFDYLEHCLEPIEIQVGLFQKYAAERKREAAMTANGSKWEMPFPEQLWPAGGRSLDDYGKMLEAKFGMGMFDTIYMGKLK